MNKVAAIKDICRYPVKSFQGERLDWSRVETYGLRGDRSHAFINHDRFDRHLSAKKIPYLLRYRAQYVEDVLLHRYPSIQVQTPQGECYNWDHTLLKHMTDRFELDLSMETHPMNEHGEMAVDEANLLITTDASLSALEKFTGEPLDIRRFRPNIVLQLDEATPFTEENWLGRLLKIGDMEIEVYKQCQRCLMISVDPGSGNMDMSLLRKLAQQLDANFGVYARVKKTGTIQTSDAVYMD